MTIQFFEQCPVFISVAGLVVSESANKTKPDGGPGTWKLCRLIARNVYATL